MTPLASARTHDNPVLPDEIIEAYRSLNDSQDAHQWEIGDFLVDAWSEISPFYIKSFDDDEGKAHSWYVSQLAFRTGADTSTIRDRESMAKFFPLPIRSEYDALTYHQLRACKSAGDKWRKWADWAIDNLPVAVNEIRRAIRKNGDLPPQWETTITRLRNMSERLADDPTSPPGVRRLGLVLAGVIELFTLELK